MSSVDSSDAVTRREERQGSFSFGVMVCFGLGIIAAIFGLARTGPNATRAHSASAESVLSQRSPLGLLPLGWSGDAQDGTGIEGERSFPETPTPTPTLTPTPEPTATPSPRPPPAPGAPRTVQAAPAPRLTSPGAGLEGQTFWSSGDSTSYYMSVWLARMLTERGAGATQVAPEYWISSGLLSPSFFNWPAYVDHEMARAQPSIVVFMIGANDANGVGSGEEYRRRAGALMDEMRAEGRLVVWVGQPNMGPNRPDLQARVPALNAIFQEEAGKRPGVLYVDIWSLTSDANGAYAPFLPNEDGSVVLIRANDGVHFTPEGGRRLAVAVMNAIVAGR